MAFEFLFCDSLQKVFPEQSPKALTDAVLEGLGGEVIAFQLAYKRSYLPAQEGPGLELFDAALEIEGAERLKKNLTVRQTELVPVTMPVFRDHFDDAYLFTEPRLAPDLLAPVAGGEPYRFRPYAEQWRSLWIEIRLDEKLAAGDYRLHFKVKNDDEKARPPQRGEALWQGSVVIRRLPGNLPEQALIRTEWFHADCLAQYYKTEVFSEEHWRILEAFFRAAVRNGVNMLYCPIFTPPLDTAQGGERLTTQLVKIRRIRGEYSFDFSLLERWIRTAQACGIKYFEMAHFFTQWGAEHAPKIMVEEDGEERRLFGWETEAAGDDYRCFLYAFIPALKHFLKELGLLEKSWFHISDEPNEKQLESYRKAKELVAPLLKDCRVIDALSDLAFYEEGLVDRPIPANNAIEPFLKAEVPELWTYYCCAQAVGVSNRFMALPSYRNRIIGAQLYKYDIQGFLHWGFNFYNSQFSLRPINPFLTTDAGGGFPSGDAFLVYPGHDGTALDSIRARVFFQALQDLRAFRLLEDLKGRAAVLELIEQGLPEKLGWDRFPANDDYILNLRHRVNQAIAAELG